MFNTVNQAVTSRELKSIERLDELSLYLEISRQNISLENLKRHALENVVDEFKFQQELNQATETLGLYLNSLTRFGIDPTDTLTVQAWMKACQTFLNNLDMVEYTTFLNHRATCQSLEFFGKQEYGKSSYYNLQETQVNKKELNITAKIG